MASSSSSNLVQERDAQLLAVGKQCSDPTCLLVDFLPFKCHHCELSFCQEHFKVDAHKCSKYDETKHNRIAPNCPLCNTPVAVRPGQDPNVRMDFHLERECSVVTGKVKAKTTPVCAKASCKKVLFSPIRCDKCRQQFCPAHRFPGDHICSASAAATRPRPNNSNPMTTFNAGAKNFNTKATAAGTAAMDAVKKSIATATVPTSSTSSAGKPALSSLPFNKMDRLSDVPLSTQPNMTHTISSTISPSVVPTTTTGNITPPNNNHANDDIIKPSPIIAPMSFIPRSIFASA
ncbi:hypothetical protein GALMADRAFT_238450 [Galerina marginata CBS 339.88]|uniref:AN1-type domain-containing protein n=1 Tax=Galerina marginata (strain CBS 339.88) TaxID=685588 RepID=A0A067TI68_GALM3|nr:hypothetical protein GALMADRAFT_238450 [Galerina marginata CBS 339.88]